MYPIFSIVKNDFIVQLFEVNIGKKLVYRFDVWWKKLLTGKLKLMKYPMHRPLDNNYLQLLNTGRPLIPELSGYIRNYHDHHYKTVMLDLATT